MILSFRWYGGDDPIPLPYIRQISNMKSIVTAVYDVPPGEVWSNESILSLKKQIEDEGMTFEVVESIPVHEDIKLGKPTRDAYIANFCENVRRLAHAGVKVVCYNFMPVFDWTRTNLRYELADKSTCLAYFKDEIDKMDPRNLSLPGWDASYQPEDLRRLFDDYASIGKEVLWDHLEYFLKKVIPVAEECGVCLAIHPDDPPWDIFGLPRIITCRDSLDRVCRLVDSKSNGLTICTGSLGSSKENDMPKIVGEFAARERIHFMHVRNVKIHPDGSFEEAAHFSSCGSLDLVEILKSLYNNGYTGYIRPDHGRMIWGETGKPGYGLYDRAMGATYLNGIWETLTKVNRV